MLKQRKWLIGAGVVVCALVLIGPGVQKLRNPAEFARQLTAYKMIPPASVGSWSIAIPVLEVAIGVVLLLPIVKLRAAAGRAAAMLFLVFGAAMTAAMLNGETIPCGCFLPSWVGPNISWWLVLRNLALMLLVLTVTRPSRAASAVPE